MTVRSRYWRGGLAAVTAVGLAGALLGGAGPANSSSQAGIVVSGGALPPDSTGAYQFAQYVVSFRATTAMVESEISVIREGGAIVVREDEGGPSLAVEALPAEVGTCTGDNPSGLSREVRCTFRGATSSTSLGVFASFVDAPQAVTFEVEPTSRIKAAVVGSPFDDYLQGGALDDAIVGGPGEDFIFGCGGSDSLGGDDGDDILYGDGCEEDNPGEIPGDDLINGGPGADYIDAGRGSDSVWGGPGDDEIDMRDSEADSLIHCNDNANPPDGGNLSFDQKLDRPYYCNANQPPVPSNPVFITPETLVEVGTTLRATSPTWLGTTPMTYSYRWESCRLSTEFVPSSCLERGRGTLNAQGQDAATKKPPVYTVTKADRVRAIRYVAIADNSKLRGGLLQEATSMFTNVITTIPSYTIPAKSFPTKKGSRWNFRSVDTVRQGLLGSKIEPFVSIRERGWPKSAVKKEQRKSIRDGNVFAVIVNGKTYTDAVEIEAAADERADIEIRYYSQLEDRKTCPATDADLNNLNRLASSLTVDLTWVTDWLDSLKCPWAIVDTDQVSSTPTFTVRQASIRETENEDRPVEVALYVRRPNTSEQLAIAVGPPPKRTVAQSPDHFTLGAAGAVYTFPGTVFTSIWVNLLGEQARIPAKQARMQMFVNGRLIAKQELTREYWSIPATVFTETGTARVVITTLYDNGSIRGQVFVDIPIRDAATAPLGDLVTWDGRCFNPDGSRAGSCAGRSLNPNLTSMRQIIAAAGAADVLTFGSGEGVAAGLRWGAERVNKRFTTIVVNGPALSGETTARQARSLVQASSCEWWNVVCAIQSVVERVVKMVVKPAPTPKAPDPPPLRLPVRASTVPIRYEDQVGAAASTDVLELPEVGLIGLDGATVIGLDAASIIGLDGATVEGEDSGSLIGLDSATLLGLDSGTLVGLDSATLVGLDAATMSPDQVVLPLISDQGGS